MADVEITASYNDLDAVREFARGEGRDFRVRERPRGLRDRRRRGRSRAAQRPGPAHFPTPSARKTIFVPKGFPVAAFRHVRNPAELTDALTALGTPAVLKTAGFGYDGKGQRVIRKPEEAADAFAALGGREAVLESFIDFSCELSVVAARSVNGAVTDWGAIENAHANHILDLSVSPAVTPTARQSAEAVKIAHEVLRALDVVG